MTEKQMISKRESLKRTCYYGLSHFCDGKPNKSEDVKAKQRMPCPKILDCKHKKNSIIEKGEVK